MHSIEKILPITPAKRLTTWCSILFNPLSPGHLLALNRSQNTVRIFQRSQQVWLELKDVVAFHDGVLLSCGDF